MNGESPARPQPWQVVFAAFDAAKDVRDDPTKRTLLKDENLYTYTVMLGMEVFMWGTKSEETLCLFDARREELAEEVAAQFRRLEKEPERQKGEKVECEERYTLEREQRERERRELEAAGAPSHVGTPKKEGLDEPLISCFIKPEVAPLHNPAAVDPKAIHFPTAGASIGPEFGQVGLQQPSLQNCPRGYYRGEDYDGDPRY